MGKIEAMYRKILDDYYDRVLESGVFLTLDSKEHKPEEPEFVRMSDSHLCKCERCKVIRAMKFFHGPKLKPGMYLFKSNH